MESRINPTPNGRPLIIPLFIPHMGCPHQCVFCNQRTITGSAGQIPTPDQIRAEVARYLRFAKKRYATIQISFFGGNFLGLERKVMIGLLDTAATFVEGGAVDSLRFSTRPDTLCPESLAAIARFPVKTVELGVQSMNNSVLDACRRGHAAADTIAAATLLKDEGYQLGLQMMVGLPGDDDAGAMFTARQLAHLKPDFVRIYPTLVLAGSPLARIFRAGNYHPLALDAGITLVKRLYLLFKKKGIPVVRMGLQASDGLADPAALLAGPYHPAFGHLVHGEIVLDAIGAVLAGMNGISGKLTIRVHPTMVSRVQGLNKKNIKHLRQRFNLESIAIDQDDWLDPKQLMLGDKTIILDA
jgi:histone acetyltransferase (RNA polymerase elongator complex component)